MADANTLRNALLTLQNKTRRDPESYKEEFLAQLEHFQAQCRTIGVSITGAGTGNEASSTGGAKDRSLINAQFIAVANFVSHVAHCFPEQCKDLPDQLIQLLRTAKSQLSADARVAIVKNIILLRGKDLVPPEKTLPVFFELLLLRDKTLRHLIIHHIIGDVKKINISAGKGSSAVNKKVQACLFSVADEDDPVQARCALLILMDLYNRNIWADERTVEVIAKGCFSKHSRIIQASLRFFLMQLPKLFTQGGGGTDSESDENDPGRVISKLKQKLKVKKKTGKRERVLDREVSRHRRKYDLAAREEERLARLSIDPLRFLRDPQGFAERLFAKLQRTTERFETRLLYLNVLARVIAEHEVVVLPLYNWLSRYMEPTQAKVSQIMALTAASVHKLVPPDVLLPLVRTIANHFINDRSDSDSITIGINTIREICKRQPLAITADLLADLVEYKQQRGDRGVIMAARALLQLYREIQPSMLPAKLRGSAKAGAPVEAAPLQFGTAAPLKDIPGMELLILEKEGGALHVEEDEDAKALLDAMSSGDDDDDDDESESSSKSGSWQSVSSGSDEIDLDAPPKLVPIKRKPVAEAARSSLTSENLAKMQQAATAAAAAKAQKQLSTRSNDPTSTSSSSEEDDEEDDDGDNAAAFEFDDPDFWVESSSSSSSASSADEEERRAAMIAARKTVRKDGKKKQEQDAPQVKRPRLEDSDTKARTATAVTGKKGSQSAAPKKPVPEPSEDDDDDEEMVEVDSNDEEEEDDEEGEWEEGEWVAAGEGDEEEEDDDDEEDLDEEAEEEEDEESEEEHIPPAKVAQKPAAKKAPNAKDAPKQVNQPPAKPASPVADTDFYEDVSVAPSSKAMTGLTSATRFSSTTHLLTEEDFARLAELRARAQADPRMKKKKDKELLAREKKRDALLHDTSASISQAQIETFTERKRIADRDEKIERTLALREASNPFNISKKRKSKTNATHNEHSKHGKLYQMAKRSARVGAKMKMSIADRGQHKKDLKKKDVKFRIRRGWKA